MYRNPTEAEIQQVMKDTGMDYLQARNHLLGRSMATALTYRRSYAGIDNNGIGLMALIATTDPV